MDIVKPEIQNLFPTPIYISHIVRNFTKQEIDFVNSEKNKCVENCGNARTSDTYILNKPELKKIKSYIQKCCDDYLKTIICPKNNIELYITQSWLNYTEKNQFHHQHSHSNSIVSGVFYFDCDKENDEITFTNPIYYQQIKPEIDQFNIWNSTNWSFALETGQLIIFPSSTIHQVNVKKGNNTRTSLAFNTFYKGTLGFSNNLTELTL